MRVLLLLVLMSTASLADSAMIDSEGHVLSAATATLRADAGATVVSVPNLSTMGPQDEVLDQWGRCRWTATAGQAPTKLATPEWPAGARKLQHARTLLAKADETLRDIVALERWQADPANVLVLDRSTELTNAQSRLAQIRTVLAGR